MADYRWSSTWQNNQDDRITMEVVSHSTLTSLPRFEWTIDPSWFSGSTAEFAKMMGYAKEGLEAAGFRIGNIFQHGSSFRMLEQWENPDPGAGTLSVPDSTL